MSTAIETREDLWKKIQELPPSQRVQATNFALQHYSTHHQYFADKPIEFITQVLDEFLWSKEREVVEAVRDHRRVAVHSCHNTGKSFIAGRIVPWFVAVGDIGDTIVVTTAPTMRQVKAILWKEIRRAVKSGDLPGSLNLTEWKVNDELVAFGQKPADWDPAAFQGIHALRVLVILDEACHDDQTEVMTEQGWKRFDELNGSENLLTMNPETHESEYVRPVRLVKRSYHGKMIEYRAQRGANFCVTPDHDMYYRPRCHRNDPPYGSWRKEKISRLLGMGGGYYMNRTINWTAPDVETFELDEVVGERKTWPKRRLPMDDWMRFLGWYCSEGNLIRPRGKPRGVGISQNDPVALDEIYQLCLRLGLPAKKYKVQVHIHCTQLGRYLARLGKNCLVKKIPDCVRNASARQIGLFLDTFVLGDGYQKGNGREIIYTSSPHMADQLQELVLKTGVNSVVRRRALKGQSSDMGTHIATSSVDGFVISRTAKATQLRFRKRNAREIDYNGAVYCATLPRHHLLLTRRDGFALWSGNCGVPEPIWDAASTLVSNEESRILAIGNPDDPTSKFAKICRPGSGWHVIHIGWKDTPNHPDSIEEVPDRLRKLLISRVWVEERAQEWGIDSPRYISKVLGEFPEDVVGGVVPLSLLMQCSKPWDYPVADLVPVELGVDVGAGGDYTVIRERRGRRVGRVWRDHSPDVMSVVGLVVQVIRETGATSVKIDEIGIGRGVVDRLEELRQQGVHSAQIHGVNVGSAAHSPTEYKNLRAQMWWDLGRGLSQDRIWDFSGLEQEDRDALFAQMIAVKQLPPDSAGRNRIEPKEDTKKTLGHSPDDADALLLAFYVPPPEIPEGVFVPDDQMVQISPI